MVSANNLVMELLEGSSVVVVITTLKVVEVSLEVDLWEELEVLDNLFLEVKVTLLQLLEAIIIKVLHNRAEFRENKGFEDICKEKLKLCLILLN